METVWLDRPDGARLRVARWRLRTPRARCLILNGRTEFVEKYAEVADDLRSRGFDVWSFDWRGQGLSSREPGIDPQVGHIDDFDTYLKDLVAVRAFAARDDRAHERWLALGHSMGGHLLLRHLARRGSSSAFTCAVLTSPMIRMRTGRPLPIVRLAASLAVRFGRAARPARRRPVPYDAELFEGNLITHDPARFARARALVVDDPRLYVSGLSWGWLAAALRSCDLLTDRGQRGRIAVPGLVVAAGDDRLVSTSATMRYAAGLPAVEAHRIEGAWHEILMETDRHRSEFWALFDRFAAKLL